MIMMTAIVIAVKPVSSRRSMRIISSAPIAINAAMPIIVAGNSRR
jgi:hypothetical protein